MPKIRWKPRRHERQRIEQGKEYEGPARWFETDPRNPEIKHPVIPISPSFKVVVTHHRRKVGKNETIKYRVNKIVRGVALATLVEEKPKPVRLVAPVVEETPKRIETKVREDSRRVEHELFNIFIVMHQVTRDYVLALRKYGLATDSYAVDAYKIGAAGVISKIISKYENDPELKSLLAEVDVKDPFFYKEFVKFVGKRVKFQDKYESESWELLAREMFGLIELSLFSSKHDSLEAPSRSDLSYSFKKIIKLKHRLGLDWDAEKHALETNTLILKVGRYENIPYDGESVGFVVDGIMGGEIRYKTCVCNLDPWDDKKVEDTVRGIAEPFNVKEISMHSSIKTGFVAYSDSREDAIKLLNALYG